MHTTNTPYIKIGNGKLHALLDLYEFQDEEMFITYCPSLDLASYGTTRAQANDSFKEVFKQHMHYCLNKNTLVQDLQQSHGWNIKSLNQKKILPPNTEYLLKNNESLQDIIYNQQYTRVNKETEIGYAV